MAEGWTVCPSNHHLDHSIIDDVFSIHVDELFNLIFTDSNFYKSFTNKRKTYDIKLGDWEEDEYENGRKIRKLHYTLSINYSIGPKSSLTKEIQTLHSESKPGDNYLIDADCYNTGIPYADNFYTTVRYCLKSADENKTRLIVTCRINFSKSTNSFLKMFIDKTALSGTKNNFNDFVQLLRSEVNRSANGEPQKCMPRRKVRQHINMIRYSPVNRSRNYDDSSSSSRSQNSDEEELSDWAGYLLTVLLATLLFVSVLNASMYMQLVTMENSLERFLSSKMNLEN